MSVWPDPLIQPDRHEGCFLYSMAYLCHCLGHPEVTPAEIQTFREQEHRWEGMFPFVRYGIAVERHWDYQDNKAEWLRYWLGPGTRSWVEGHLAQQQISVVIVERVPGLAHALVLLESKGDEGVFLMDPLSGFCVEPWEWFLSVGPGNRGCYHIDGWYSKERKQ